jgi:hypothetical protein
VSDADAHGLHAATRRILATPPVDASVEDVRLLLQAALEVERFTIPPYLTALYSIHENANVECAALLRAIVVQEMLHMSLVCNVLNAIGGSPDLRTRRHLNYPQPLPYSDDDYLVGIGPFTPDTIHTFVRIEQPGQGAHGIGFHELSQFYRYIEKALTALNESTRGHVFRADHGRQVGPEHFYGSGGRLLRVTNLKTAREVLDLVIVEGEGTPTNVSGGDQRFQQPFQLGHYFAFKSILLGRRYVTTDSPDRPPSGPELPIDWRKVARMRANLTLTALEPWPNAWREAMRFRDIWADCLDALNRAFNGQADALQACIMKMFELKYQAQTLMRLPLDRDQVAGPVWTFEG